MTASTRRPPTYGSIDDGVHSDEGSNEGRAPLEMEGCGTLTNNPSTVWHLAAFKIFLVAIASFVTLVAAVRVIDPKSLAAGHSPAAILHYVPRLRSAAPTSPIPFEHVDRAEYSSIPAKDIVDPSLFDPSLRGDPSSGSLLKVPFPTGAFWTNLVLCQMTSDMGLSYPIMVYPYGYKWSPSMIQVSYPPLRRLLDEISIRDIFNPDLTLSIVESAISRHVMGWDPLSATLRYSTGNDSKSTAKNGYWETYLVQGSPYVTLAYHDVTPVITALSIFKGITCPPSSGEEEFCSVAGQASEGGHAVPPEKITLKGTRFLLHTRENLTWMVFASQATTLSFDNIRKTTITSAATFSGVLRLALIPPPQDQLKAFTSQFPDQYESLEDMASSSGVRRLSCHANVYPVGGKVTWDFPKDENVATVQFRYDARTMDQEDALHNDGCESRDLLMLALPHHVQVLEPDQMLESSEVFDLTYQSIKGVLVPVLGSIWSYDEPLTTIGFESASSLQNAASLDDNTREIILEQVKKDMFVVLPTLDENVYGFGKQVARLAQLAHIASVLDETFTEEGQGGVQEKDDERSLTVTITQILHEYLSAFLLGRSVDKLLYDTNFGGIISKDGLEFSGGDFGNGWYNDHLFHYGYVLYASAILGQLNSTFVSEHGSAVDALLFDVAYISNADLSDTGTYFFPFTRHKSWYDSHSFASGLFPFADGKSMESSAESVNCYYGAYLWSLVRWGPHSDTSIHRHNSSNNVDFARLLLAMEIRGVKTYWHMITPDEETDVFHISDIYNPIFAKNLMVGNVGMMDVTVATWFGTQPLYVHMINFLPITAITRVLFEKSYIKEEFTKIIEPVYHTVEMAWRGYVTCDRAMNDPNVAWQDALELRSYELDQAISQSQVLYFVSTTEGFVAPKQASDNTQGSGEQSTTPSAFCSEHKACVRLGLVGNCCPASVEPLVYLSCCSNDSESQRDETARDTSPASLITSKSLCAENKACDDIGLTGNCCPSSGGVFLGCCDP